MDGGPSHYETFDPKPDAPLDIRGTFRPIATSVPGMQICELLPMMAQQAIKQAQAKYGKRVVTGEEVRWGAENLTQAIDLFQQAIARDGEGATKFMTVKVERAKSACRREGRARTTATPLACSSISRAAASGWPLYQATNSVALMLPVKSSPGIPSRRSLLAPKV